MTAVFGHDSARRQIYQAASSGRLHHGWILAGPPGIGKASLAREMALCLLAGEEKSGAVAHNHPQARLFEAGTHPDYAELHRIEKENGELSRNIGVDQIRALGRLLSTAPSISQRRLIMVDSADDLERSAANALLKSLEEPPANVVFLLISHAPSRLLPTIRSRCRMIRLSPLGDGEMAQALACMAPDMADVERDKLIRVGAGSPGRAMALSGLGIADMLDALERIASRGDRSNRERLALAKALSVKSARARYEAFLEQVPALIARASRGRSGPALADAILLWERARDLSASAIPLSLDPSATVFELCTLAAGLCGAEHDHAA